MEQNKSNSSQNTKTIRRVRPSPPAPEAAWKNAPFSYLQTELSPATLYHAKTKGLRFFANAGGHGLGTPTHAAYATRAGVRVVRPGQTMDAKAMSECWALVWFAGAKGWTDWDSPWVVYLQHKPTAMRLDDNGLRFSFPAAAGYAVLMPLYGYAKLPQPGRAAASLPPEAVFRLARTEAWSKKLPADVLERVRYWAGVSREFPIYCEDSFRVDPGTDTVTIRQRFDYVSIRDDWKTPHRKLAPVSPVLALAAQTGFPVRFSRAPVDPEMFTPYGPYQGIEGVDSYDIHLPVLKYVHEMEAPDPPGAGGNPVVQEAVTKLQETARSKFRDPNRYEYDHGSLENFCWAIQGDEWYAKGLPYYDAPTRKNALASLRKYFREDVLVPKRFTEREYPKGSGRTYLILEGPGIGSWGALGDAGKFSTNMLQTVWAYAHYTDDWALIKERWPLIKKLFCTPAETRWVGFGRDAIAEIGDEAAPCLALARMAHKIGDRDTYAYACYMFARELAHLWVKQRGASYFVRRQPWHTPEPMPANVYLTNLWGDVASWQIDGPTYPKGDRERQYTNRWVRFKNEDVGRFYRDHFKQEVAAELDQLQARLEPKRRYMNDSHIMPSLVQLRSLLLNESPDALARTARPQQFGGPPSGVIASCLSVLRTSSPAQRYVRLVPKDEAPTAFMPGLEREVGGANTYLAQVTLNEWEDNAKKKHALWPLVVTWWGWKTPSGGRWTVGQVVPEPGGTPRPARSTALNWNTEVVRYPSS